MKLKYIEIHGFKSFPDRTRISFGDGVTGVVGPNGSGKSNICDALRWVLGERSTKTLRGDKMEDVIFSGSENRSAMGYCTVSIGLDNTDRRLDVDADEVVATRRYYRSGESEYAVNGAPVRLRDLQELFMDTGLGRDGYSIIGQGRISEIVSAKGTDRREIFEEASGIAKYRMRRTEAMRDLDSAQENLERLHDIADELGARVAPLKAQAEKAERFLEYSGEKKSLEITLWNESIKQKRETLRGQDDKIFLAKSDYERLNTIIERLAEQTENDFRRTAEIARETEKANADIHTYTEEIAKMEASLAVFENDIKHAGEGIADIEKSISEGEGSRADIEKLYEQRMAEAERCRALAEELTARRADIAARIERLNAETLDADEKRSRLSSELAGMTSSLTELRIEAVEKQSVDRASVARLEELARIIPENEARLAAAQKELSELLKQTEGVRSELVSEQNVKDGLELKLSKREEALEKTEHKKSDISREADACRHRIRALEELENSLENFAPGVRAVLAAKEKGALGGIIGAVSSVINAKKDYETAIETALGAAAQNVVVENERAAKEAIEYLKNAKLGRATFLPLDTVQPSRFDEKPSGEGVIGLASELVECDSRYARVVSFLLGRIVVTETLSDASKLAKKLNYRYRIVTCDGQTVNAGGSFTGGFTSRAGAFTRRVQTDELRKKLVSLEKNESAAAAELEEAEKEIALLKAERQAAESVVITLSGDVIRCEGELKRVETEIAVCGRDAEAAAAERERLEKEHESFGRTAERIERERANAEMQIAAIEKQLSVEDEGDESDSARRELSDALSQLGVEIVAAQKDMENFISSANELTIRGGDMGEHIAALENSISGQRALIEEKKRSAEFIEYTIKERRSAIEESQRIIANATAERFELEKKSGEMREEEKNRIAEREMLTGEIARLGEQKLNLENQLESHQAKLWEEYELTPAEAEKLCVPFESMSELTRRVNELRAKIRQLGTVYVGAIEEYKDVSARYDFLSKQMADVERSREELLKLINELTEEMKTLFVKSFTLINRAFSRTFTQLFGGGSARLSLSDENDILESGIDIEVNPPGKIIKNLASLSGGEQALVAIAIYFAILEVNPSPFCILDEIESALDEVNVVRFASYLHDICDKTQFIAITHRRGTMEQCDVLYGVTMQEKGVTKLLRLNVEEVEAYLVGEVS